MPTCVTSDGQVFQVESGIIRMFGIFAGANQVTDSEPIPLHNVSSAMFTKVLEYCEHYVDNPDLAVEVTSIARFQSLPEWDKNFINVLDKEALFELILAANYLEITSLLNLGSQKVSNMLIGKTPREIRAMFNITDTDAPDQEATLVRAPAGDRE